MSVITFRVPNLLRKQMAKVKINWSEYVRRSISEVLESDTKRALIRKMHALHPKKGAPSRGTAESIIRSIRNRG